MFYFVHLIVSFLDFGKLLTEPLSLLAAGVISHENN